MTKLTKNIIYSVLFCFFTSFLSGVLAFAHSGHSHEEKLRISLPSIVAKVNGQDIHNNDILSELKKTLKNYKDRGVPLNAEEEKITAKKLIDNEIGRALLLQKGKEIGANITDDIVEKQLRKIKASFESDAIFEHKLKNQKLTIRQYKKELKVELIMQHVINIEIEPNIEVSEAAIKSFYEKNEDKFRSGKKARASVILIKSKRGDKESEKSARKKTESILEKIKKGSTFSKMATEYSQDSLAAKGGDLGYFTKNQIFGAFSERAFDMKVNEITPVFKTGLGFHILKLTDLKEGDVVPFDKAKTRIEKTLRKNKVGNATRSYVETLKQKSKIKMYF